MSISVVSTIPNQTPATVADNSSGIDATPAGSDFASLLFGQLAPIVPSVLSETLGTVAFSIAKTAPVDDVPADAASILASLGFAPAQALRTNDTTPTAGESSLDIGTMDSARQTAIAGAQATTSVKRDLSAEATSAPLKTFSRASGPLVVDEKPANIAALVESTPNVTATALVNAPVGTTTLSTHTETTLSIPTPIRDQSWAQYFSQKITWLATSDKQTAQITLNPAHMGPIEISLNLDKSSATASFVSANAEVRDAIETAMPRLREMFANAGIELGQTNVSSESFRQQSGNDDGNSNRGAGQGITDKAILGADSTLSLHARTFSTQRGNGLVDIFA